MPRFFIGGGIPPDELKITIFGEDAFHISHVLRMKPGEPLTVCDDSGIEYECVISDIHERSKMSEVVLSIKSRSKSRNESPCFITVFQGIIKGDKMDTVIQKSVELGASEIVPVACENSVSRLDSESSLKKTARWQKIATEAAKQCGRGKLPCVLPPVSFKDMVSRMGDFDISFACYEAEHESSIRQLLQNKSSSMSFFIGPEGGISPSELSFLADSAIPAVTLGRRILRTETAAATVLSMILYETEL